MLAKGNRKLGALAWVEGESFGDLGTGDDRARPFPLKLELREARTLFWRELGVDPVLLSEVDRTTRRHGCFVIAAAKPGRLAVQLFDCTECLVGLLRRKLEIVADVRARKK